MIKDIKVGNNLDPQAIFQELIDDPIKWGILRNLVIATYRNELGENLKDMNKMNAQFYIDAHNLEQMISNPKVLSQMIEAQGNVYQTIFADKGAKIKTLLFNTAIYRTINTIEISEITENILKSLKHDLTMFLNYKYAIIHYYRDKKEIDKKKRDKYSNISFDTLVDLRNHCQLLSAKYNFYGETENSNVINLTEKLRKNKKGTYTKQIFVFPLPIKEKEKSADADLVIDSLEHYTIYELIEKLEDSDNIHIILVFNLELLKMNNKKYRSTSYSLPDNLFGSLLGNYKALKKLMGKERAKEIFFENYEGKDGGGMIKKVNEIKNAGDITKNGNFIVDNNSLFRSKKEKIGDLLFGFSGSGMTIEEKTEYLPESKGVMGKMKELAKVHEKMEKEAMGIYDDEKEEIDEKPLAIEDKPLIENKPIEEYGKTIEEMKIKIPEVSDEPIIMTPLIEKKKINTNIDELPLNDLTEPQILESVEHLTTQDILKSNISAKDKKKILNIKNKAKGGKQLDYLLNKEAVFEGIPPPPPDPMGMGIPPPPDPMGMDKKTPKIDLLFKPPPRIEDPVKNPKGFVEWKIYESKEERKKGKFKNSEELIRENNTFFNDYYKINGIDDISMDPEEKKSIAVYSMLDTLKTVKELNLGKNFIANEIQKNLLNYYNINEKYLENILDNTNKEKNVINVINFIKNINVVSLYYDDKGERNKYEYFENDPSDLDHYLQKTYIPLKQDKNDILYDYKDSDPAVKITSNEYLFRNEGDFNNDEEGFQLLEQMKIKKKLYETGKVSLYELRELFPKKFKKIMSEKKWKKEKYTTQSATNYFGVYANDIKNKTKQRYYMNQQKILEEGGEIIPFPDDTELVEEKKVEVELPILNFLDVKNPLNKQLSSIFYDGILSDGTEENRKLRQSKRVANEILFKDLLKESKKEYEKNVEEYSLMNIPNPLTISYFINYNSDYLAEKLLKDIKLFKINRIIEPNLEGLIVKINEYLEFVGRLITSKEGLEAYVPFKKELYKTENALREEFAIFSKDYIYGIISESEYNKKIYDYKETAKKNIENSTNEIKKYFTNEKIRNLYAKSKTNAVFGVDWIDSISDLYTTIDLLDQIYEKNNK